MKHAEHAIFEARHARQARQFMKHAILWTRHRVDRKWMVAPFNKFCGKMWDGLCFNTRKRFLVEVFF